MTPVLGASHLKQLDAAMHDIHAASPVVRRVLVSSLQGGVGTTTVTRLLAQTFARHRGGRILLTDGATPDATFATLPSPTDEERSSLPAEVTGDLRRWRGTWRTAQPIDDRWFDVSLIDAGRITDATRALDTLGGAAAICLVSSMERSAGEQAIALADALAHHPEGAGAFTVFVDSSRSSNTWPRLVCERSSYASTVLPYDRAVAADQPSRLGQTTRLAMLTAAGDAMTARRITEAA